MYTPVRVSVALTSHVASLTGKLNKLKWWEFHYLSLVVVSGIILVIGLALCIWMLGVAWSPPDGSKWNSYITISVPPSSIHPISQTQ